MTDADVGVLDGGAGVAAQSIADAAPAPSDVLVMPGIAASDVEALALLTPDERARFDKLAAEASAVRHGKLRRPASFREFVDRVTGGRFKWYRYAVKLGGVLQSVADGQRKRVIIGAPPRHGKSEEVSRLFPAYYLYRHPAQWAGLASFGAELAHTLSRAARGNYFHALGQRERGSVRQWETGKGGGMWSAGVGGTMLGKGYHVGIIDDPIKNAEEASSERKRERQKEWWRSTFSTRMEPGAAVVIIMQRWSEDDLVGFLLDEEWAEYNAGADGLPERWHIVNFEAIKLAPEEVAAEEARDGRPSFPPTCTVEPDWRAPGEALCPERMDAATLARVRRRVGEYFWWALYQQRPRVREGTIFRFEWFETVSEFSRRGAEYIRWWDKATSTEDDADYTVGALLCRDAAGQYTIVDIVRGRWSGDSGVRERIIRETAEQDVTLYGWDNYVVWGEQEPGSAGKDAAAAFVRNLEGFTVFTETTTGDKVTNASPLAAAAQAGNVQMLRAAWNPSFRREVADFPRGKHDDMVEAVARGYNKLARNRHAPPSPGSHTTSRIAA